MYNIRMSCVFCEIVAGNIPSTKILENENIIAITPLHKVAPVHALILPKKHIEKVDSITGQDKDVWAGMIALANEIIIKYGLDKTGYRLVNNGAGYNGVEHEHIHVLGGRGWKPTDNL